MEDFRFVPPVLKLFFLKLPSVKQHFKPKHEGSPFQKASDPCSKATAHKDSQRFWCLLSIIHAHSLEA